MPELPEVENVCRAMADQLLNKKIIAVHRYEPRYLRPHSKISIHDCDHRILSARINAIHRRAKYIIVQLDRDYDLLLHLGMSGIILLRDDAIHPERNDITVNGRTISSEHIHLQLILEDLEHNMVAALFIDTRRFGRVEICHNKDLAGHHLLSHLGYEPLPETNISPIFAHKILTIKQLITILQASSYNIKTWLLNQKYVVGIGNIYASEILFCSKINPHTRACDLSAQSIDLLFANIKHILTQAINHGGSTWNDYALPNGEKGQAQKFHLVYDKKGNKCQCCSHNIESYKDGNSKHARTTFWCPRCQS